VALIVDTSAIVAMYDRDAALHRDVERVYRSADGPLVVPVAMLAEVEYMLRSRLGSTASLNFLEALADGTFDLEPLLPEDLERCRELISQYDTLNLGLADTAVMATAERLSIQTIFTLDERHFRIVRPRNFTHFILYPADYPNGN
jgi:predicted nucleic acid-binding protein